MGVQELLVLRTSHHPGWETGDEHTDVVTVAGSPVRIGPQTLARLAMLTCGHYLTVGRSPTLLRG